VRLAQRLAGEHPEWLFLYQYANVNNPLAHYRTTGPEILSDVPEITHFVAGLGTSGTLMGVGRYLKEHKPGTQIWAIEPPSGEMVDGLRNLDDGYVPPIFIENDGAHLLDRKVVVRAKESIEWTRRLTAVGLFTGISAGAIMAGAVKCASLVPADQTATIVTIVCDDGWKYLSTGAWSDDIDDVVARAKQIIYF
jgi:cysteine synthase B